ncbi:MAG: hypothetical protein MK135_06055, partial [Polyangiaceae bacterium]|nr:hypothetical protein [Polyangiaceae bacterium]
YFESATLEADLAELIAFPSQRDRSIIAEGINLIGKLKLAKYQDALVKWCEAQDRALFRASEIRLSQIQKKPTRCRQPAPQARHHHSKQNRQHREKIKRLAQEALQPQHPSAGWKVQFESPVGPLIMSFSPQLPAELGNSWKRAIKEGKWNTWQVASAEEGFALRLGLGGASLYDREFRPLVPRGLTPSLPLQPSIFLGSELPRAETGSLLLTLGSAPQLYAKRSQVGKITGPWEQLISGDSLGPARLIDENPSTPGQN